MPVADAPIASSSRRRYRRNKRMIKAPKFEPRVRQAIDIPLKLRFNLYIFAESLLDDFDSVALDHKMLKYIASLPESKTRARLSEMKMSTRLDFDLVEAEPCLKMFETFFSYLGVEEDRASAIQSTSHLLEITTGDKLTPLMPGFQMVQFAAAFFARETGGLLIDPLAYKIYEPDAPALQAMLSEAVGKPQLRSLLSVFQSTLPTGRLRTTSHGLCRFGLPEFDFQKTAAAQGAAVIELIYRLAQALLEDLIEKASQGAGIDAYSFREPLPVSTADCQSTVSVPLRLHRTVEGRAASLAHHGRQHERDQALVDLLTSLQL
ncbi:MAG: hypothetical protein KGS72_01845 [Cyanobacteria bacterium REEB67]|nr:hypothetical protein [Cyanobacteria bacterium REEB67]